MNIPKTHLPRIVIIGAGFGGIALAKSLGGINAQVVLIDRHNYHLFQPLLYQVATAGLDAGSIAYPVRKVMHERPNFYFRMARVTEIDAEHHCIISDIGSLRYDYLVIASGTKTNFFGNGDLERNSVAMKTLKQALNIRSLVLENFEQAVVAAPGPERDFLMTFVVVGGGPTGVELAGALADMRKHVLHKDYPDLDLSRMQIHLIQSGDRLLNTMSEKSSAAAEKFLLEMDVQVHKKLRVTAYDGHTVVTSSGMLVASAAVLWTAGVTGAAIAGLAPNAYEGSSNRILVNKYFRSVVHERIYIIGDLALNRSTTYPNGHPQMAQPAIQMGKHLGANLKRLVSGRQMEPFVYRDKGSMATIGRNRAVVDLPRAHFNGFFAWLVWMFVHLFSLIGFHNKAMVLVSWVYNYINYDREGRLIVRPFKKRGFVTFTSDEI